MANGKTSQVQFKWQRPQATIYRVGENQFFTTIQDAINQAVADGFNSHANPALVEIYPKVGGAPYVENLTLNAGVSLIGIGAKPIFINGNHNWTPVAGTAGTNRVFIENINFNGVAGAPTFTFGGTNAGRIFFKSSALNREGLDDGLGCFVLSNTNNSSRVVLTDSNIYHFANAGGGYAFDMQRGRLNMLGNCEVYCEGAGGVIPFALDNNANINARGGSYPFDTFFTESGATIFEINSNAVFLNLSFFTCQNQSGSIFQFNDSAFVLAATCGLITNGSPICDGAGNGTLRVVNPVVNSGDAAGSTYGGNYGFNAVADNVIQQIAPVGLRLDYKEGILTGYVGFDYGYPSIQSAMDQLFNYAGGNFFKIKLADGVAFNENVIIRSGAIIEGLDDLKARSAVVQPRIDGSLSFVSNPGSLPIYVKNIEIVAQPGGRAFEASYGGGYMNVKLQNCSIKKIGDATVDETILVDAGGNGGLLNLDGCEIIRHDQDVGIAINAIGMDVVFCRDCTISTNGVGGGLASNNRAARVESGRFDIEYGTVDTFSEKSFEIFNSSAILNIRHATINAAVERGEVFRYTGNGSVRIYASTCEMSNILEGAVLARDGVQATGNFLFSGNVYAPGDGIEINGVNFINGIDFAVGGSIAATVANIAAAINSSGNPSIQNVVYAIANGSTLEIYSWNYSAASNAITISVVATAPAVASGATLTGGVTGAGGFFAYNCAFGRNLIQNTLNIFQLPTTVQAI